jgi:hypothetical protein
MPAAAPQLELFRPKPTNPNVAWLTDLLLDHGRRTASTEANGWLNSSQIITKAGFYTDEKGNRRWLLNDRDVRALAEAASPKIISGQKGYKHADHATADELNHCSNSLKSQAVKMLKRSVAIRRYAHAKIGS